MIFKKIFSYLKKPSNIFLYLADKNLFNFLSDEKFLKLKYRIIMGKKLNLEKPTTFNEKMQWLKLNDRQDFYIKLVDKYRAKKYVSNIIGDKYIIPTLGLYDSFDEIDFDILPNQFVIKCTHDSGGVFIVKDKDNFDKRKAKKIINKSIKRNYYYWSREWPYKDVKPKIIVEKYMGYNLNDYKFFCFNGEAKYCLVCTERVKKLKETFFDMDWNIAPFKRLGHDIDEGISRPKEYNLMIEFSKKLSYNMPFVRIDFYEVDGNLYFGEMTFYPASGFSKFDPEEWDYELGSCINLPKDM